MQRRWKDLQKFFFADKTFQQLGIEDVCFPWTDDINYQPIGSHNHKHLNQIKMLMKRVGEPLKVKIATLLAINVNAIEDNY